MFYSKSICEKIWIETYYIYYLKWNFKNLWKTTVSQKVKTKVTIARDRNLIEISTSGTTENGLQKSSRLLYVSQQKRHKTFSLYNYKVEIFQKKCS